MDADSITSILNTHEIRSSFLQLLQTKLGFFTSHQIDDFSLRYVLEGFPIMVKNKGNIISIKYAVHTFLKINHIISPVVVAFQKEAIKLENGYIVPARTLVIGINSSFHDTTILEEIFKYILPAGIGYYFYFYTKYEDSMTFTQEDKAVVLFVSNNLNDLIKSDFSGQPTEFESPNKNRLLETVDGMTLITDYFDENYSRVSGDTAVGVDNNYRFLGVHYSTKYTALADYLADENVNIVAKANDIILFNDVENVYINNSWISLNIKGAYSTFPSNPAANDVIFDVNSNLYKIYSNNTWSTCTYPIYIVSEEDNEEA